MKTQFVDQVAWSLREAFFRDALDIADDAVQWKIAERRDLDCSGISTVLNNAQAMAALMDDYNHQRDKDIKVSPSLLMNEGRQALLGNVGYKAIEANINEALRAGDGTNASWC